MDKKIELTHSACAQIIEALNMTNNSNLRLRTSIMGGGCAGFEYQFLFDEWIAPDDYEFEFQDSTVLNPKAYPIRVVIDCLSYQYLAGSTIDFKETLQSTGFTVKNPNAQTTCGCGSSFSMKEPEF